MTLQPETWKKIEKPPDLNLELKIKVDIPEDFQNLVFKWFKKTQELCLQQKRVPLFTNCFQEALYYRGERENLERDLDGFYDRAYREYHESLSLRKKLKNQKPLLGLSDYIKTYIDTIEILRKVGSITEVRNIEKKIKKVGTVSEISEIESREKNIKNAFKTLEENKYKKD